jgi:hydroxymethylbilane synthase
MFQANLVAGLIRQAHTETDVEIIEILTSGDWKPEHGETRLSEAEGGKGQFAKEIERAILDGEVDCGVHSMKDMESFLPEGLVIEHILPREDARDAFISDIAETIDDLPNGAVVGTASMRRQAFLLAKRPDLKIVPFRGNVPTRIEKLRSGKVDATILALAGLKRLKLQAEAASVIEIDDMLPSAGQGAIGIEIRKGDAAASELLAALHCRNTGLCVAAERAALQYLDGSCRAAIGAHATLDNDVMLITVAVSSADGQEIYKETQSGTVTSTEDAEKTGTELARVIKGQIPLGFLAA